MAGSVAAVGTGLLLSWAAVAALCWRGHRRAHSNNGVNVSAALLQQPSQNQSATAPWTGRGAGITTSSPSSAPAELQAQAGFTLVLLVASIGYMVAHSAELAFIGHVSSASLAAKAVVGYVYTRYIVHSCIHSNMYVCPPPPTPSRRRHRKGDSVSRIHFTTAHPPCSSVQGWFYALGALFTAVTCKIGNAHGAGDQRAIAKYLRMSVVLATGIGVAYCEKTRDLLL